MKSICITGVYQPNLTSVAKILQCAGVLPARAVKREEPIDIEMWHEQVIAIAADESSGSQTITNPGRLWEQLAGEIFISNIKSKVWAWADTRSTWLLDYWSEFEPRLNFVLVCVSPQQMLANAMVMNGPPVSVDTVMNAWQQHHLELLRFHHRNPLRSVLVDALECFKNPQALVHYCATKWKLPIAYQTSGDSSYREPDALALYLAQQMCQDYPQTATLQHEVSATLTRLDDVSPNVSKKTDQDRRAPETIFASYRALKDRSAEILQITVANKTIKELGGQKDSLVLQLDEQQKLSKARQIKIDQLGKIVPPSENKAEAQALKKAQHECKEAVQEAELLLLQLHQVQEELENYYLQRQEAQTQLQHEKDRWKRMLQRTPDYCDYESIQLVSVQGPSGLETHWKLERLEAVGRLVPQLEFSTIVEKGIAGFVFMRQAGTAGPLLRWPLAATDKTDVLIIPTSTPDTEKARNETLRDLAFSDLQLLQTLARLLIRALGDTAAIKAPTDFDPSGLTEALVQFIALIERHAATSLCYDRVVLKREQVNPDYEHLWLVLENTRLQGRHWPAFEFRLACANIRPNELGANPKLEFPEESGRAQFENWFAEATDDFGAKFELRFAMPQSMDVALWQRLSNNDRRLIARLLGRLPFILGALEATGTQLSRPFTQWITTAGQMQRILAQRIAPPQTTLAGSPKPALTQAPAPVASTPTPPTAKKVERKSSAKATLVQKKSK